MASVKLYGHSIRSCTRVYETKEHKKLVRVLSVLGYVFSVSLAAIVLSLYYVFLWDPNMHQNINRTRYPVATLLPSETANEILMATTGSSPTTSRPTPATDLSLGNPDTTTEDLLNATGRGHR